MFVNDTTSEAPVFDCLILDIVRGVLGLLNSLAILSYRRTASRGYGRGTANWYLLLQCSQFHVMYYASRTLPNMFAFGLSKW